MHRREFLKVGASFVGASALMPLVFRRATALASTQRARGAPVDNGRVLVVIQMAGGNDGLNTVVPVSDGRYYSARPELAVPALSALPLDATSGLSPSLPEVKSLWDAGLVAIVEGVGYPQPNFSHFVSMDVWQTADPAHKVFDGWLGRYLSAVKDEVEAPFLGLAIGSELPTALETGSVAVPALDSLVSYQFQGDPRAPTLTAPRLKTLRAMYGKAAPASTYGPMIRDTLSAAEVSVQTLQSAHQTYKLAVPYPANNRLAAALQLVAEAIGSGTGVKICHVSIGGFDTHADQPTAQSVLLANLSSAVSAFYGDLKAHGLDSKVLMMTWSEFGRRVKANASSGTDHGSAAPLFFMGTPVKGGLYGQRPDLGNLDNGNLRYTVDFRSVYATALESWLGVASKDLLGAEYERFPLLR